MLILKSHSAKNLCTSKSFVFHRKNRKNTAIKCKFSEKTTVSKIPKGGPIGLGKTFIGTVQPFSGKIFFGFLTFCANVFLALRFSIIQKQLNFFPFQISVRFSADSFLYHSGYHQHSRGVHSTTQQKGQWNLRIGFKKKSFLLNILSPNLFKVFASLAVKTDKKNSCGCYFCLF